MANEAASRERVQVRPGRDEDLPALRAILADSPQAAGWLPDAGSAGTTSAGAVFLVSEFLGEVTGFVLGRQTADEAEILNVAVRKASRRGGAGSTLLNAILAIFRAHQAARVFLEVRESNAAATAFYHGHGFRVAGRRAGYYHHPAEAAVLLKRELTG